MIQFFIPLAISSISGIISIVTKSDIDRKYIMFGVCATMLIASIGVLIYYTGIVSAHENVVKDVEQSLSYNHNYYKGLTSKIYFSNDTAEINRHWKSANDTAALRALEKEFVEEFLSNTKLTIRETEEQLRIFTSSIIVYIIIVGAVFWVDYAIQRNKRLVTLNSDN